MKKSTGFLVAVGSAVFWGSYGTFTTFLGKLGLTSVSTAMIGPLFIFVFFTVANLLTNGVKSYKLPLKLIPVVLLYGFFSAMDSYAAVTAYSLLPIAVGSIIIYCNLFLLILFSRLLFQNKLTKKKLIACAIAIVGIALVVNVFNVEGRISFLGLFWAFIAMCCWAGIVLCEKYLLNTGLKVNTVLSLHGIIALVLLCSIHSPVAFVENVAAAFTATGWRLPLTMVCFGLFTEIFSYLTFMIALKRLEPALVQIAYTLDPVTSCLLAMIFFGQILVPVQYGGIILILAVVAWLHWDSRKEEGKEKKEVQTEAASP
ncbi:MAG TPA: DMT family transporter [Clostridiales bacterium]|nr:DMT family transporter [Clostridiales bacterium]